MEEMWIISNGVEEKTLVDLDNPWKVDSILEYEIIKTMLRTWAEIRGLRILGQVTQKLEVSVGYSVNRTLNYMYTVRNVHGSNPHSSVSLSRECRDLVIVGSLP